LTSTGFRTARRPGFRIRGHSLVSIRTPDGRIISVDTEGVCKAESSRSNDVRVTGGAVGAAFGALIGANRQRRQGAAIARPQRRSRRRHGLRRRGTGPQPARGTRRFQCALPGSVWTPTIPSLEALIESFLFPVKTPRKGPGPPRIRTRSPSCADDPNADRIDRESDIMIRPPTDPPLEAPSEKPATERPPPAALACLWMTIRPSSWPTMRIGRAQVFARHRGDVIR
jgi:hypothetical protein